MQDNQSASIIDIILWVRNGTILQRAVLLWFLFNSMSIMTMLLVVFLR